MNHLYRLSDGVLVSSTALPIDPIPEGMGVVSTTDTGIWNPETLSFDPRPAPDVRLSRLDFLRLFTTQERVAIRTAGKSDPVIEDFLDLINAAETVSLNNADTVAGVNYMVSQGLLTAERGAEVLNG